MGIPIPKIKEVKKLTEGNYLLRDLEEIEGERHYEVKVKCPKCKKLADITIPEKIRADINDNLVKVCVGEGKICPHSFIVYLDKQFKARGTEYWDVKV
jgi:phage FluMu protein Com